MNDSDLPKEPMGSVRLPNGEYVNVQEYYDTSGFVRTFNTLFGSRDAAIRSFSYEWDGVVPHPFLLRQIVMMLDDEVSAEARWIFATEGRVSIGCRRIDKKLNDTVSKCYFEGPPFMALAPKEALVKLAHALSGAREIENFENGGGFLVPTRFDWLAGMAVSIPLYYKETDRWTVRLDIPKGLVLRGAIAGIGLMRRPVA